MSVEIHPTAIVHPRAQLASGVRVGAYSIIGEFVEIGVDCTISSHVVIEGCTRIGERNRISSFSVIGGVPQDKKYHGEASCLEVGNDNTIREYCTLNVGTEHGGNTTRVGSDNWIMAYVHIAHDCQLGNNTIIANNAQLAGHVCVGDWAVLGGFTGVHQFVRIGDSSFIAAGTILKQDLPPYVIASGYPAAPGGVNAEGLKRRGFSEAQIRSAKRAYKILYRSRLTLDEASQQIAAEAEKEQMVALFSSFLKQTSRGILR